MENIKTKGYLRDINVDGWVILKLILKKVFRCTLNLSGPIYGSVASVLKTVTCLQIP
jgi:hypothetical protein